MVDIQADRKFAAELCEGVDAAKERFMKESSDKLLNIAKRWEKIPKYDGYYVHKKDDGTKFDVTEIQYNAYIWLAKQAYLKSCQYRGDNNARFDAYIFAQLNDKSTTFVDYLRWRNVDDRNYGDYRVIKSHTVISKPKDAGYVPKCVENLGEIYGEVYKMRGRYKSFGQISSRLKKDEIDVKEMWHQIEIELLKKSRIADIIGRPVETFSPNPKENSDDSINRRRIESTEFTDPSKEIEIEMTLNVLTKIIDAMTKQERRILSLYWIVNNSPEHIYEKLSDLTTFGALNFNEPKDVSSFINKIIYNTFSTMKSNYPNIVEHYNMERKFWRHTLKEYFIFIMIQRKNYKSEILFRPNTGEGLN